MTDVKDEDVIDGSESRDQAGEEPTAEGRSTDDYHLGLEAISALTLSASSSSKRTGDRPDSTTTPPPSPTTPAPAEAALFHKTTD